MAFFFPGSEPSDLWKAVQKWKFLVRRTAGHKNSGQTAEHSTAAHSGGMQQSLAQGEYLRNFG